MLRKKNYKEQQHFTRYFTLQVPRPNGARLIAYYKRYRPNRNEGSLYDAIHDNQNVKDNDAPVFPVDRTLEIISFDEDLKCISAVLRSMGKLRRFQTGESKYKGKVVFYGLAVFKFQFDLVKCFRDDYLQVKANELTKDIPADQEQRQAYRQQIIVENLHQELALGTAKLKALQYQGYNVVTDVHGQFRMDFQANRKFVENLPQIRKKKKEAEKHLQHERTLPSCNNNESAQKPSLAH